MNFRATKRSNVSKWLFAGFMGAALPLSAQTPVKFDSATISGLPARNIVRFFDHHGEDWTAKPELRALCNFRQANLCGSVLPFASRFDVIFLRNVMLYFSQETRKQLLANIHRLLAPDGILFLGSSEQPADPTIWTSYLAGGTCYFRPRQPS